MLKEIFFTNENGQIEINFESLELQTNSEFSKRVKNLSSMGSKIINIVKNDYSLTIYLKDTVSGAIEIYEFQFKNQQITFHVLTIRQQKELNKIFNDVGIK